MVLGGGTQSPKPPGPKRVADVLKPSDAAPISSIVKLCMDAACATLAAMQQPKRAIVAGPGNPPVVIDETADLDRAARAIIRGGAYDNNLLCIGEKQVFVVEQVFDAVMQAMERAGAITREMAGRLPRMLREGMTEREAAIKDGSFTVEINDEEPKSS